MDKDEFLIKRIQDLASLSDRKGCVTFTDFLNLNEQNILHRTMQKFSWINGETFGGYEGAERQMAAFVPGSDSLAGESAKSPDGSGMRSPSGIVYPIHCIYIVPRSPKYAEHLSHRDFLGALMNLGIDRSKTGDIAVMDMEAYLFCSGQISEMVCRELTQVRRTQVVCSICGIDRKADDSPTKSHCAMGESFVYTPATETIRGSIASVRLDAVMALGFGASRSSLLSLIANGSVYVNGKLITTNAYTLKENDIVSVRGMGRFRYLGIGGQTRKGRIYAEIQKFV